MCQSRAAEPAATGSVPVACWLAASRAMGERAAGEAVKSTRDGLFGSPADEYGMQVCSQCARWLRSLSRVLYESEREMASNSEPALFDQSLHHSVLLVQRARATAPQEKCRDRARARDLPVRACAAPSWSALTSSRRSMQERRYRRQPRQAGCQSRSRCR